MTSEFLSIPQAALYSVTGFVVVLFMLAAISLIIGFEGKVVSNAEGKAAGTKPAGSPRQSVSAPAPAPVAAPAPKANDNVKVAVIAAAVAAFLGTSTDNLVIRRVRKISNGWEYSAKTENLE